MAADSPLWDQWEQWLDHVRCRRGHGMFTLQQAGLYYGVHPATVRAWLADGTLDGVYLGSRTIRVLSRPARFPDGLPQWCVPCGQTHAGPFRTRPADSSHLRDRPEESLPSQPEEVNTGDIACPLLPMSESEFFDLHTPEMAEAWDGVLARLDRRAPENLMTVAQAADYLNISQSSIRRWIRTGDLRAVRLGAHAVRIRFEDVKRFGTPIRG